MMNTGRKFKLTFEADGLAVPEIHTGEIPQEEGLEEVHEKIQYDTIAVPEVHLGKKKNNPGHMPSE